MTYNLFLKYVLLLVSPLVIWLQLYYKKMKVCTGFSLGWDDKTTGLGSNTGKQNKILEKYKKVLPTKLVSRLDSSSERAEPDFTILWRLFREEVLLFCLPHRLPPPFSFSAYLNSTTYCARRSHITETHSLSQWVHGPTQPCTFTVTNFLEQPQKPEIFRSFHRTALR